MDCVRTVLRMGAEQSIMTYRRSIQEIPVDELELEEAEIEGVEIMYMVSPTRVIGDGDGRVTGIELIRNELGAPDAKGRRRPEPVPGSEFVIPCDMVLVAIGQRQDNNLLLGDMLPERDRRGVPLLDQNLQDRAAERLGRRRLRHQPDQLHLLHRRGQARRRADRRKNCAAPSRRSRRWRSPASRPSTSPRRTRSSPRASPSGA